MGTVISLDQYREPSPVEPIVDDSYMFDDMLAAEDTLQRVGEGIAKLYNIDGFVVSSPVKTVVMDGIDQGTVHPVVNKTASTPDKLAGVATSIEFPEVLMELGFSEQEAFEFAADYTHIFGIAFRGLIRHPVKRTYESSHRPEIWHPNFVAASMARPYRIAAVTAFTIHGILPLRTTEAGHRFLPHIAALHNPLSEEEAQASFQRVMIKGSVE
jgi:hypothetical protein